MNLVYNIYAVTGSKSNKIPTHILYCSKPYLSTAYLNCNFSSLQGRWKLVQGHLPGFGGEVEAQLREKQIQARQFLAQPIGRLEKSSIQEIGILRKG